MCCIGVLLNGMYISINQLLTRIHIMLVLKSEQSPWNRRVPFPNSFGTDPMYLKYYLDCDL